MSKLTKDEKAWLKLAQQHPYVSLSKASQEYYDSLMAKLRIPEAVEKASIPKTKTIVAPTQEPQKKAPEGDTKMIFFVLGFVIIGMAARWIWLDWQKPIQKSAPETVVNKTKSHGK